MFASLLRTRKAIEHTEGSAMLGVPFLVLRAPAAAALWNVLAVVEGHLEAAQVGE